MKKKDVVIRVRFNVREKQMLEKISKERGIEISSLIRSLVREYLFNNKNK